MGPIWGRQDTDGPYVGPMNFLIWVSIRNTCYVRHDKHSIFSWGELICMIQFVVSFSLSWIICGCGICVYVYVYVECNVRTPPQWHACICMTRKRYGNMSSLKTISMHISYTKCSISETQIMTVILFPHWQKYSPFIVPTGSVNLLPLGIPHSTRSNNWCQPLPVIHWHPSWHFWIETLFDPGTNWYNRVY